MTNTMTRSQAKRWTLGAQLASALFVFSAVGVGIIGLPEPKGGATIEPTQATTQPIPDGNTNSSVSGDPKIPEPKIDTVGVAQRLALLDNAPNIVDNTVIETAEDPQDPSEDTDGSIVKRVRYIGFINDATTRHAFIRIDGKQRIVELGGIARAGSEDFPDLKIERITPTHILVSDGKIRSQINLASRTGQSITMAGGEKVDVAIAATNGSLLTAEDEANIAAMPARQQPLARRRLEREKRGLSPDKERRRPTAQPLGTARGNFNSGSSRVENGIRNNRNNRND